MFYYDIELFLVVALVAQRWNPANLSWRETTNANNFPETTALHREWSQSHKDRIQDLSKLLNMTTCLLLLLSFKTIDNLCIQEISLKVTASVFVLSYRLGSISLTRCIITYLKCPVKGPREDECIPDCSSANNDDDWATAWKKWMHPRLESGWITFVSIATEAEDDPSNRSSLRGIK